MERLRMTIESFRWVPGETPFSSIWWPVGLVGGYLLLLWLMDFALRPRAALHNLFLVILSAVTAVGMGMAAFERFKQEGRWALLCSPRERGHVAPLCVGWSEVSLGQVWDGAMGFWAYVYYLTKYYELFDTVLLSLRRKTPEFLHVYHHSVMPFGVWSWLTFSWMEGSWWAVCVNSAVHTPMYFYFLMCSLERPPKWKRFMTASQVVQFVSGSTYIAAYLVVAIVRGGCGGSFWCGFINLGFNMYFLYLFTDLYVVTYFPGRSLMKLLRGVKDGQKTE